MRIDIGNPPVDIHTNILSIEVPQRMEHAITTGNEFVDRLFAGDGVIPSTVSLVTGIPGSGKTTLSLQLADSITGAGGVALFNTNEEALVQVRKTCRRMELKHGFIPSYIEGVYELLDYGDKVIEANPNKQLFLFVDSLQTMCLDSPAKHPGRPPGLDNQRVKIACELAAWAKKTMSIVFILGQVTKEGVFSGRQEIKHAVDAHLHLDQDRDRTSESYGERIAEVQKNRFGLAGVFYPFCLTQYGISFNPGGK